MATITIHGARDPDEPTTDSIEIDGRLQPEIDALSDRVAALEAELAEITASGTGGAGFCSVNPVSIVLDGVTDATNALQAELNRLDSLGGGTLKLIGADGIRVNSLVTYGSNITLELSECPVIFGARGCLKAAGEVKQVPPTGRPYLFADGLSGDTVIHIVVHNGNVTPAAGQRFVLRGQHTRYAAVLDEFESSIVAAVNQGAVTGGVKWAITMSDPLDSDFLVDYPDSAYAPYNPSAPGHDYSTLAINVFSLFTSDVAAGAMVVPVADDGVFAVNDYVFLSSTETAGDAVGKVDRNPVKQEMNRVVGIDGNSVKLARALSHDYATAYGSGMSAVLPVTNSHVIGARIGYAENGDAKTNSLYLKRAVDCSLRDCHAEAVYTGIGWYSALKNTLRDEGGWRNRIERCTVIQRGGIEDANTASGLAYGIVLQGTTDGQVTDCHTENCRHGVLIQAGASGFVVGGHTDVNARISGIDCHGINARSGRIHDCTIIAGPSNTTDATQKAGLRIGNSSHWYGDFDIVCENIDIRGFGNLPERESDGAAVSGIGISVVTRSGGLILRNILVEGSDYGIHMQYTSGDTVYNSAIGSTTFDGVTLKGCHSGTMLVDGGAHAVWPEVNFRNCTSDGNGKHFEVANAGTVRLSGPRIINPVGSSGTYSVKATQITGLSVCDGRFDGANRGVSIKQCPGAQILNTVMANQAEAIVLKDDTSSGNNNGFIFVGNLYPGTASPAKSLGTSSGTVIKEVIASA